LARSRAAAALLPLLFLGGCFFDEEAPDGPSELPISRPVSVTVEYVQSPHCQGSRCGDSVIFFGSWMRPGQEFALRPVPGTWVWTGTATGVPVNFPPDDTPYLVRVYDPHLVDTPTGGVSAVRLKIGGQILYYVDQAGTPGESGLVYVDDNGVGHNPFY
jgi:hypothetical protein